MDKIITVLGYKNFITEMKSAGPAKTNRHVQSNMTHLFQSENKNTPDCIDLL